MARTSIRIVLGAVVLAAAAIAFAPAVLLDAPLSSRTRERFRLVDASGFWWRGQGTLSTADGRARMPLAWRVELAPLAQGLLVVHLVGAEAAAPSGTSTSGHGRIDVRDLRLRIPAAAVGALDPRLQSVALGGNVAVDAPSFAASGQDASGTIDVRWANARLVAANTVVDLGTVSLAVAPAGNHAAGTLRNVGGDVAVDGTLTGETGALEAVLTLRPTTTTPDSLRTMLPLLGVPDGAGGARVTWRSDR